MRDDLGNGFELVLVGGGNMGAALLGGLLDAATPAGATSGRTAASIAVVEVYPPRRDELSTMFPGVAVLSEVPPALGAVLAVKPADTPAAAAAASVAGAGRVLSIAAGVRLATLEAAVGPAVAVVRAMPNTPALVRLGASAIAGGERASEADLEWAEEILGSVGTVERLDEAALDAFTGVAGSGPAYVFLVAEALIDAAVEQGLDRDVAERVVSQLLLGASTLLARDGDPARLREQVTSPGGTTAAGLAELDRLDLRGAFSEAVRAATVRSSELG